MEWMTLFPHLIQTLSIHCQNATASTDLQKTLMELGEAAVKMEKMLKVINI